MRILCAIATRGRPLRLAGTLHSLTTLASGKNQIDYVIGVDQDDKATLDLVPDLGGTYGCLSVVRPRPVTLGDAWNSLAKDREWDVCAIIADKHLCLTPKWDTGIARLFGEHNLAAARWNLLDKPLESVLMLPRKWYEAVGYLLPPYFPFWFSERWVVEVFELAFGAGLPMVPDMLIAEPPWKTQGLRDLKFWFDFFAKTRVDRVRQAHAIATAFNIADPAIEAGLAKMRLADAWQKPRIKGYYETRGDARKDPPSPAYIAAKARAAAWLEQNATREFREMEPAGAA